MTCTVRFGDERGTDPALVGGKAAALGALTHAGLPVPPGFAVTVLALQAADRHTGVVARLDALAAAVRPGDVAAAEAVSAEAERSLRELPLPAEVAEAIAGAYRALAAELGDPHLPVAVRSSAVGEDGRPEGAGTSFAGEYESVLWVRDVPALHDAVRRCWAGLWTARAVTHRGEGGGLGAPAMGLAVQQMVRPRVAGVAFTLDPSTGDRSRVAIDAAWGLGSSVASGEVTPDSWRVDRVLRTVTDRRIAVKTVEHRLADDGQVVAAVVEPARRSAPSLDDDEVLAVARLVEDVEARLGGAQDVEWAVAEGEHAPEGLRLLQARPETVWSRRTDPTGRSYGDTDPDAAAGIGAILANASPVTALPAGAGRSPFDDDPAVPDDWSAGYPRDLLFDPAERPEDAARFWFHDAVHWPGVVSPWEATLLALTIASLTDATDRLHVLPASRGVRVRVHRGHAYLSPVVVEDPAEVAARLPEFERRARDVYARWDALYDEWVTEVTTLVGRIEALAFDLAPDAAYQELRDLMAALARHHFSLLDLGYAAYLDLFTFCRNQFPGIPDLAVARMVSGADSVLMRPDRELRRLARLALELGVDRVFTGAELDALDETAVAAVDAALAENAPGREWLAAWGEVAHPWFAITSGSGFSSRDRSWAAHRAVPYRMVGDYLRALHDGLDVTPGADAVRAESARIAHEYASLIAEPAARAAFERRLALARTVFPLVENHSFYVEQWGHTSIWDAMRRLAGVLVGAGRLDDVDDVFLLGVDEVAAMVTGETSGWRDVVRRRHEVLDAMRASAPPPALGAQLAAVSDPLMVMLWGVTPARSAAWLDPTTSDPGTLTGLAASPGVAEGPARVVHSPAELAEVRDGEVLVAPITSPGWAPVFSRVAAIVTDVGGVMSHAAIVCREFGLPAVTGTVDGTRRIRTGQRVRVDGGLGTVTLLDDEPAATQGEN